MAIEKHGDNTFVFAWDDTDADAIALATGLRPQTLKIASAPEFVAKAEDEDGLAAASAVAPDARTATMTGYVVDKTKFESAASFTFETRYYVITGRNMDVEAKEYRKGEFTAEQNDGITAPVV